MCRCIPVNNHAHLLHQIQTVLNSCCLSENGGSCDLVIKDDRIQTQWLQLQHQHTYLVQLQSLDKLHNQCFSSYMQWRFLHYFEAYEIS